MKPTLKQRAALRRNKYGNKPTYVDGIRFASKAEAKRYAELQLLERAGEITGLRCQPEYPLHSKNGHLVAIYRGDFEYLDVRSRKIICEDVKSPATAKDKTFRIKWKHAQADNPHVDFRVAP